MLMWYVYFLELSNKDVYVGYTGNLKQRVLMHNSGQVIATKRFLPIILKSYVAVESKGVAIQLEKCFKSGSGKAFAKKRLLTTTNLPY